MVLKRIQTVFSLSTVLLASLLLTACQWITEDHPDEDVFRSNTMNYINLTITVSNGEEKNATRAVPEKGENGDGREAGFERENAITSVTLILYKDAADKGINGDASLPLDFIAYYPVLRVTDPAPAGTLYTNTIKTDEAFYSTGNQLIAKNALDFSSSYFAIVIANADLRGKVSTLDDVRKYKMNTLYSGSEEDAAQNCVNFIMSSEENYKLDFTTVVATSLADGNMLYNIESPIRIERMAARIDFWAANSNGYKTSTDNAAYTTPGYEYNVTGSTTDKFVVTGIMPFNLNGGDITNGGEFLIKRLANEISASPTITYLADETGSNYVLDPATQTKADGYLTYFKNTLQTLAGRGTLAEVTTLNTNPYYKSVASMHAAVTTTGSSAGFATHTEGSLSGEDVIIAYPMENTLWAASRLYNYATGIAIEGDYYTGGSGTPDHRIYYGYMRHQGSSSSAYSAILGANMSSTEATTSANCMEFGIVRNNIYRVYISSINAMEKNIKIKIEETKWRHVDNPPIYI